MPRNYNYSSSKKNNAKPTPSNSSKKDKNKSKQTNSTANPDQRIDSGEMPKEGGNILLTPTHSAATAACHETSYTKLHNIGTLPC